MINELLINELTMSVLNTVMARLESLEQRAEPQPRRRFTPDAEHLQVTPHTHVGCVSTTPSSVLMPIHPSFFTPAD
jgi:hypothetical protein